MLGLERDESELFANLFILSQELFCSISLMQSARSNFMTFFIAWTVGSKQCLRTSPQIRHYKSLLVLSSLRTMAVGVLSIYCHVVRLRYIIGLDQTSLSILVE
jgi:hypothetical protein